MTCPVGTGKEQKARGAPQQVALCRCDARSPAPSARARVDTETMAAAGGVINIPVRDSDEFVEVNADELPDDPDEILDILKGEMAPLDLWLRVAVEYYKQGKLEQFKLLLDPLVELEAQGALYDQFGTEPAVKTQFIAILNALAGYHMVGATRERDKQRKKAGFDQAKKYYDAADIIDVKDGRAMLGVAVLDLCQGQLVKAEKRLDLAAQFYHGAKSGNVPALLGAVASSAGTLPLFAPW